VTSTGRSEGIGTAERSARRILVIDSALLIVIVLAVHVTFLFKGGQGQFPLWSLMIAWLAAFVTIVAGVIARRVSDLTLRLLALTAVALYWMTLATFPAAVPAQGIERIPWTLSATGAAAAAALVAGGRTLAWATVIAGTTAGMVFRTLYGGLDLDGVVNDLQALLTGALICVIGGHMLAVGRGLDGEAAAAAASASRESAESGRLAARTKAATLVHDEVLATLVLASTDLPIPRERLAAQARAAVSTVTSLADGQAHEPVVLRAALAEEARLHCVSFSVRGESGPASGATFAETHEALIGAMRQALRNSIQHAPDAARSVVLIHTDSEIRVEISDNGPGFDPDRINDDRLGIRQSIIGRMNRLPGGSAEIDSAPGRGTVIRLRVAVAPEREIGLPDNRVSLRVGVTVLGYIYVITQAACALLSAIAVPGSWPLQLAMLATALGAAEILRAAPHRVPSLGRTAVVVSLAGGGLIAGVIASHALYGMAFSYGTMWFAVGAAFLLVSLALRGRSGVALAGTAVIVAVLVTAGVLGGAPAVQIVQVGVRPVVLVGLAVALLLVVDRMQRRITLLHREALVSAQKQSWTLAARSELTGRVAELARTVIPLLRRIGRGTEPTDAERSEYASCEGDLRDGLRAGSLARDPLRTVVAAARERGVDVLLLDDHDGFVDEAVMAPILAWMADAIGAAETRVVGRLLPAGRPAQASLTVDGTQTEFTGARVTAAQAQPLRPQPAGSGPARAETVSFPS